MSYSFGNNFRVVFSVFSLPSFQVGIQPMCFHMVDYIRFCEINFIFLNVKYLTFRLYYPVKKMKILVHKLIFVKIGTLVQFKIRTVYKILKHGSGGC